MEWPHEHHDIWFFWRDDCIIYHDTAMLTFSDVVDLRKGLSALEEKDGRALVSDPRIERFGASEFAPNGLAMTVRRLQSGLYEIGCEQDTEDGDLDALLDSSVPDVERERHSVAVANPETGRLDAMEALLTRSEAETLRSVLGDKCVGNIPGFEAFEVFPRGASSELEVHPDLSSLSYDLHGMLGTFFSDETLSRTLGLHVPDRGKLGEFSDKVLAAELRRRGYAVEGPEAEPDPERGMRP